MELNVCKLAAVAVHALIIGICHAMCAQKIYKPSLGSCAEYLWRVGRFSVRVVIFTAAVTLEQGPGSPLGAGHGPVRVIGLWPDTQLYDRGEQNSEISLSIKSVSDIRLSWSCCTILLLLEKTTIFNLICWDWMNMKSNIYRFCVVKSNVLD